MKGFTLKEAFDAIEIPIYAQAEIRKCYGEPHRAYHGIGHLEEMLRWVPKDHPELRNVIEAILYHDLVHSAAPVAPGLDEALSCAEYLAYTFTGIHHLNTGVTPFGPEGQGSLVNEIRVIEAINATSRHTEDQRHLCDVSKLVLDLDLSTFALPWEEYTHWSELVMKELAAKHSDVPEELLALGRHDFLFQLNARHQLYYLKTEWETQARANIEKTLS